MSPGDTPEVAYDDTATCYVIYTSGSTGKPKGVVMPHSALANLVLWQVREDGFLPACATLQFAPLSFDVHFQELFVTWASGGSVVIIADHLRRDAYGQLDYLAEMGVQVHRRLFPLYLSLFAAVASAVVL